MLKDNIIITDIGSTTTKALLLRKVQGRYKFVDYTTAYTTVEKPYEDVKIGIVNALRALESKLGCEIVCNNSLDTLNSDYTYLSTSSAGGGLQILVVGLTKKDSVRSATRVVQGAGGVLLDALSIDDGKSSFEKLQVMNKAHPDIILFCGGVNGGALFSIYRLAEILRIANIKQKFSEKLNIPLVYAGNVEAIDFLRLVFREKYDLHITSNLRPSMAGENLDPAKVKVHDLFLENVMEQDPGYSEVKKITSADIIPTPSGVLNSLKILGKRHNRVIAFDMGGATTDVYTHIYDVHNRSVSANIGMSYSIGNILALADYEGDFQPFLQNNLSINIKDYFLNYVGNKVLYPDFNPSTDIDKFLEHIVAISGIKMSVQQHFDNHYKARPKKWFNALFKKPKETIYTLPFDDSKTLRQSDFQMIIGAGGIFSHASVQQAIFLFIQSFSPTGVVEFWRDRHFILPHLGVLSSVDEAVAEGLLYDDCLERIAVYVRPRVTRYKKGLVVLSVNADKEYLVKANDVFIYSSEKAEKITVFCKKCCQLAQREFTLEANVPLVVDTRDVRDGDAVRVLLEALKPYNFLYSSNSALTLAEGIARSAPFPEERGIRPSAPVQEEHHHSINIMLPCEGTIHVQPGDRVTPTTLIGENRFEPPQIYVVLISTVLHKTLTEAEIREGLKITLNDRVEIGTVIYKGNKIRYFERVTQRSLFTEASNMTERELTDDEVANGEIERIQEIIAKGGNVFKEGSPCRELITKEDIVYSPVKGIVDRIDYQTGTIIIKEIQDYPLEPVEIDVADQLKVKPTEAFAYIKKVKGDFVIYGELLAQKMTPPQSNSILLQLNPGPVTNIYARVDSEYTGRIQDINAETGIITICYDKKPYQAYSMCYGVVESVVGSQEVNIAVDAEKVEGKIGFGHDVGGLLRVYGKDEIGTGDIVYASQCVGSEDLLVLQGKGIGGLICNTITYSCLRGFLQKDIGVVLTGEEVLPFSLVILKGFTGETLEDEVCEFDANRGKYVLIKPQTQIRAGATRPGVYMFDNERV